MEEYKKYIRTLKGHSVPADYSRMYSAINERMRKKDLFALGSRIAAAGALALIAMMIILYSNISPKDYLSDYVLGSADINGTPIAAYVFSK